MDPDLVVIGGGAAGLGAARAARRRDASVVLVQDGPIGGDCTFTGCIPSKSLLAAAAAGVPFDTAMADVRRAVARVADAESAEVLRNEGITVVDGRARFHDPRTVGVDGRLLRPKAVVIATGARPTVPAIPGLDVVPYLTSDDLFALAERPRSLAILGAGPIGVEMAEAFARMGTTVTLIDGAGRVLPREEPEASRVVADSLAGLGVAIHTDATAARVSAAPDGRVILELSDSTEIVSDRLLVAVGRQPNTWDLGLDAAGVDCDNHGCVRVDATLRTSVRHVFAAGDVAQTLQFTHVADETGRMAAGNALSRVPWRRFDPRAVPWVTFTSPEVARVGMTESDAARCGGLVAELPMSEVDRALAVGRTEGFVKLLAGPRRVTRGLGGGRILGATIVAPRAGEMLQEVVLAMRSGMFPARLALTTHAYPTWSTAVQQTAAQFFGEFGGRSSRPARVEDSREPARRVPGRRRADRPGGPGSQVRGTAGTPTGFRS